MVENSSGIRELRQEFEQKKKEIFQLRSALTALSAEKETIFHQLKSSGQKVKSLAASMKALKDERDALTKQVQELKGERAKLNSAVKEKASEKKKVEEKRDEIQSELEYKGNPRALKHEIEVLERKIETEVMPFSKEQQLRKRVKELQARYKEATKLGEVWKEVNTSSADFSETRRQAEESHHSVQEKAQEAQQRHEKMTSLLQEIKKLRAEEKPQADKYTQLKEEVAQTKKKLDEAAARVEELRKILHEDDERSFTQKAQERTMEVREKIKKGKKLSTEDILAFQALKE
ncbi:TPA: hypothetical protein HA234_00840 [Candidatus Woesearchaeota archaeon]|nr:hypothetical protein [Candidatus Woesearchaeota archaeon]